MLDIAQAFTVLWPLLLFIAGMVIYSIFIFNFYRFVAEKDIFELDLEQFNKVKHAGLKKFFSVIAYLFHYVFLFPLFIFFWFAIMTLLLAFLARGHTVEQVALISIAVVCAIRFTAYYTEDLSKDLAKMLPFALLGVFLVDFHSFSLSQSFEIIKQLPSMFITLSYYFLFVIILEFILRISDVIVNLFKR